MGTEMIVHVLRKYAFKSYKKYADGPGLGLFFSKIQSTKLTIFPPDFVFASIFLHNQCSRNFDCDIFSVVHENHQKPFETLRYRRRRAELLNFSGITIELVQFLFAPRVTSPFVRETNCVIQFCGRQIGSNGESTDRGLISGVRKYLRTASGNLSMCCC